MLLSFNQQSLCSIPGERPNATSKLSLSGQESHGDDYTRPFTSVVKLFRVLYAQNGDFVVFQGVEPATFPKVEAARERRGSKVRFHYYPAHQRLLVTTPNLPHEIVHGKLTAAIYRDLGHMGLRDIDLEPAGSTTCLGSGGSSAEPDASFMPTVRSNDPGEWPTLVIETGVNQSLESLHTKMRWWYAAADHAVKIVLLIKTSLASRSVLIEKYIKEVLQTRPGATNTRLMSSIVCTIIPAAA
ncbi:dead deah box dna helicase [Ophiostoma piceae UAMH 11346]|uniref:Dead deah box dna helicase n=1 Tax=Ophiostoma piceae (strain UAMH 11346) TaxID=1262450 RepID=S3BZX7_OPHP1|nr:dead deah box dna helicase [Ophiostoma piceae UAMH 11346]